MFFISSLLETKILRPGQEDHGFEHGVRPLSADESRIFNHLCRIIDAAQQNDKLTVVYRGERKSTLGRKLDAEPDTPKFMDRLFYVGEKAKRFFRESEKDLRSRAYLRSMGDLSNDTLEYIFGRLHRIVTQGSDAGKPEKCQKVEQFKKNHPEMVKFFGAKSNAKRFVDSICSLKPAHKQEEVRDYYLYLLHTYGMGNISFFVSTSTMWEIAKGFALDKERQHKRSIIFYYFVPKPASKHGVSLVSSESTRPVCQELGLPIFTEDIYLDQYELSIKGALFPHFILGYYDLEFDYFVANPHIFEQHEDHFPCISRSGFLIDKSRFKEAVAQTGYSGYVKRWLLPDHVVYTDKFQQKSSAISN